MLRQIRSGYIWLCQDNQVMSSYVRLRRVRPG